MRYCQQTFTAPTITEATEHALAWLAAHVQTHRLDRICGRSSRTVTTVVVTVAERA